MRSNQRLQRVLEIRQLGGANSAAATAEPASTLINDLRLFALTFVGGFLFMTIFLG